MILSDRDIKEALFRGTIQIKPLDNPETQIQAAWVDLTLSNEFTTFKTLSHPYIDVRKPPQDYTEKIAVNKEEAFILHPREFVLGITREEVSLPSDIAGYLDGRSSLGRLGLVVHVTSGWIDPGFCGRLVLEITNIGKMPLALYPAMRIAKLVFLKLTSPAELPYNKRKDSKYAGQKEICQSKIEKDFL
jgi:dCTP deaminase